MEDKKIDDVNVTNTEEKIGIVVLVGNSEKGSGGEVVKQKGNTSTKNNNNVDAREIIERLKLILKDTLED